MPSRRFSHGWKDFIIQSQQKNSTCCARRRGPQLDLQLLESWFGHLLTSRAYFKLHNKFASFSGILRLALYSDTVPKKKQKGEIYRITSFSLCSFSLSTIHEPELGVGRLKQWDQTWRKWQQVTFFEASLTWNCTMTPWCHLSWEKVDIAKPMTGSPQCAMCMRILEQEYLRLAVRCFGKFLLCTFVHFVFFNMSNTSP